MDRSDGAPRRFGHGGTGSFGARLSVALRYPLKLVSSYALGRGGERGDVAILFAFLMLLVLLLGATVVATLSVRNLRSSSLAAGSTEALYAADTAVEAGLTHYFWGVDADRDGNFCTVRSKAGVAGTTGVFYHLVVSGDPVRPFLDAPKGDEDDGNCPDQNDLRSGSRALCVTAVGASRNDGVRRRVHNDTNTPACRS